MFGVALLSSALLALADARIYERCELARDLLSFGVRREHLATWVCIAFHESRFDTAARNPYSGDYGILQISELYWCGAGKACGLPCSALRDDDISDDVECALRIYEEHTRLQGNGFLAWVVYPQHCKHNAKKYLADCESSVKTPSVRTDGRTRVLRPQNRNVTAVSNYPKIDELLPPYLTIGSVFSGNYEREFEQNYNNKVKIDWLNYKIDNIDELKLPVFNQKVRGEYTSTTLATPRRTTTSTTTTTTTTESPLPRIKPPNPRRIESNSFRRKKLRPIFDPVKFIETTDSSTISSSTITPRNIYISTTDNVKKHDNLHKFTFKDNIPSTTTTIKPSTRNSEYFLTLAAVPSAATELQGTTKTSIIHTTNPVLTTNAQKVSAVTTEGSWLNSWSNWRTTSKYTTTTTSTMKPSSTTWTTENRSPTTSSKDLNSTVISVNSSLLANKSNSSFSELKNNLSVNKSIESTSISSSSSIAPTTAIKNSPFYFYKSQSSPAIAATKIPTTTIKTTTWRPWSNSWSNWRTTAKYTTTTTTSTMKPSSTTRKTENTSPGTAAPTRENISIKESKHESTTPSPWIRTRTWYDFKVPTTQPTKLLDLSNNTSSTRVLVESTTSKPPTTPTFFSRSTTKPTIDVKSTTSRFTSTKPPIPTTSRTTVRSTQSIFDLYLNPTKRSTIAPFSLSPFKNSGLSLRIFAGGTTTHAPTFTRSDNSKSALEETTKNQERSQIWQRT